MISCVGHEVDFTIADFVADLRAPTPSAAAELAVPVLDDLQTALSALKARLGQALTRGQQIRRAELNRLSCSAALSVPRRMLVEMPRNQLDSCNRRLQDAMQRRMDRARKQLDLADGMLRAMDPERVIDRGYALLTVNGRLATRAAEMAVDDQL